MILDGDSWFEGKGTGRVFTRLIAYSVVLEFLIVENLKGGVVIVLLEKGHVGDDVTVVDHSPYSWDFEADELG